MMLSSPRWTLLLDLLLAATGAWCNSALAYSQHGDSDDMGAEGQPHPHLERSDDGTGVYNGSAYASLKCRRNGYQYGARGNGNHYDGVRDSEYGRLNDLTSSCKSRATNARGHYTSRGLCYFAFHSIGADAVPSNRMSVACSDDNLEAESRAAKDDPVGHPVAAWADACVGDFPRCYKLDRDRDERVVLRLLCAKTLHVPAGATHLSVDCTADKDALKKMLKNGELDQEDPYTDPYMRQQMQFYAFVAALAVAACACCFLCLLLFHRFAFVPYLKTLKRTRSDPELAGLTTADSSRS
jgi:hypothetical protein